MTQELQSPKQPAKSMCQSDVAKVYAVKKKRSSEKVQMERSLGCRTLGACYLVYYSGIVVAVKEKEPKIKV